VVIINDGGFNAFVADGRRIFVNYGALIKSETPNQLIGVLAHETGHLAGGHLAKMREQLAQAQTQMIIAMLLGAGAVVAGARSGNSNSGLSNVGAAAISAPQEVIKRTLLSYVRQQEENADRAGVKFLTATGQSAKGMYETFQRFTNDSLFAARGADPYLQSHPHARGTRGGPWGARALEPVLGEEGRSGAATASRHDARQDVAFMERQDTVYRAILCPTPACRRAMRTPSPPTCTAICARRWPRSTAWFQVQPNNPYFYELRGQALLERGKPADAIVPLRKAVQLSNNAPLIEMLLGQALVASDNKAYTEEAIAILRAAVARETEAPIGYTQLAMAYGRKGDYAQADLASAQAAFLRGDNKTAARPRLARKDPASPSARPVGSRPTISSPQSRCPARKTTSPLELRRFEPT